MNTLVNFVLCTFQSSALKKKNLLPDHFPTIPLTSRCEMWPYGSVHVVDGSPQSIPEVLACGPAQWPVASDAEEDYNLPERWVLPGPHASMTWISQPHSAPLSLPVNRVSITVGLPNPWGSSIQTADSWDIDDALFLSFLNPSSCISVCRPFLFHWLYSIWNCVKSST